MAGRGVTVDFNANVARFTSAVDKATNDLSKFQSNAARTAGNIDKSFASLAAGIRTAFAGITAALSLRELGQMADSFQNIQARLRLATRDAAEFAEANDNIKRIAQSSQSPLESTATLYTRISQSLLDIGGTQAQVAATTQALALGLRLSGATAGEASSAMLQFSQAIGSGVLRGEEFNAVNEAAPRVMKALADALGVPIGKLREMATEGQITRDILVNSLGSQLPTLIKEAETLPNTIGAAFQAAKNELLLTVGAIDKVTGASNAAANAVNLVTKGLAGWRNFFNPEDDQKIDKRLGYLRSSIDDILTRRKLLSGVGIDSSNLWADQLDKLNTEALTLQRSLEKVQATVVKPAAFTPLPAPTLGPTKEQIAAANAAVKAAADLREKTFQHEIDVELAAFNKFYTDKEKAAKASQDALDALNKEGQNLKLSVDPLAKMNAELDRYRELLSKGVIDQRTFNLAVEKSIGKTSGVVKDEFDKMTAASIGFQTNVQNHLGNSIYQSLNGDFQSIGQIWKQMLARMVSDALAANLSSAIFGANGSGGLLKGGLDILGSLVGGVGGKSGTKLGSSNFGQFLWPTFATGGDHMGGLRLVGERGPELEATGPSRIFNASQTRDILSGGSKGIVINDNRVINIDSRADRATVYQDMQKVSKQSNADLVDKLTRQGVI